MIGNDVMFDPNDAPRYRDMLAIIQRARDPQDTFPNFMRTEPLRMGITFVGAPIETWTPVDALAASRRLNAGTFGRATPQLWNPHLIQ